MLFGNLKGINEEENVVELKVELGIELLRLGSLKGIRELMVKVELIVGLVELAMVEVIFVLDRDGVTVEDITYGLLDACIVPDGLLAPQVL